MAKDAKCEEHEQRERHRVAQQHGVDEAALPEDVKLTAETKAQLSRLREWAKGEMERRRAEPVLEVQAEPEPSQQRTVMRSAVAAALASGRARLARS